MYADDSISSRAVRVIFFITYDMHTTFWLVTAFPAGFRSLEMVLLVTHVTGFAPGWACSLLHDVHTTAEFTFLGSRRSCRFCCSGWRVFLLVGPNSMDILCTISYAKSLHLFLSGLHGLTEEYGPLEIQVFLWYKAFPRLLITYTKD